MPIQQAEMTRRQFLGQAFEVAKKGAVVAVALTALPVLLDACSSLSPSEAAPLSLPPEISAALKDGNRFWDNEDLLLMQLKNETAWEYKMSVLQKPPFYNGSMPLDYESLQQMDVTGIGTNRVIADSFGTFTNEYVYSNYFSLAGARTVNGKKTLAEAMVVRTPNSVAGAAPTLKLWEIQYDGSGKICFAAESELDGTGLKTKELLTTGVKQAEYYFLMPVWAGF